MFKLLSVTLILFLAFAVPVVASEYPGVVDVKELIWVGMENTPPMSGEEIKARYYTGLPFRLSVVYSSSGDKWSGPFLIIVNEELYPQINDKLMDEYVPQLEGDGISVEVWTTLYGTPEDLRDAMADYYSINGFYYCMQVGEFPPPLSEIGFFPGESTPYPIDFFFMDLDGEWIDYDEDGYYDDHTGSLEPDIVFGRLAAYTLSYGSSDEAELVNHYLDKNLAYRRGETTEVFERALAFIDDDWFYWAYSDWGYWLAWAYPDTEIVADYRTTADEYRDMLDDNYEYIFLAAHSNPNMHQFKIGEEWESDTVHYTDIINIQPIAQHYNFFCCSSAQYTFSNYIVGWYIFNEGDYGLMGIGSAKTGSMLYYEDFYPLLAAEGYTFGEAFRYWLEMNSEVDRWWFYGMTLIGDPLLKPYAYMVDIEVAYFKATPSDKGINLAWELSGDELPLGFNLYRQEMRSDTGGDSSRAGVLWGDRATLETRINQSPITGSGVYHYLDDGVSGGGTYRYRLEAITEYGLENLASCEGTMGDGAVSFNLSQNYPNPWSGSTTLGFTLSQAGMVLLELYDISGRMVEGIVEGQYSAGEHSLVLSDEGLESGLYLLRLTCGERSAARIMVLMK